MHFEQDQILKKKMTRLSKTKMRKQSPGITGKGTLILCSHLPHENKTCGCPFLPTCTHVAGSSGIKKLQIIKNKNKIKIIKKTTLA